jgi:dolichol-phosphate mannosyltransferase
MLLSIVVPVFNEEGNIAHLAERVLPVLRNLNVPFELIIVDDGSRDNTWKAICQVSRATPELIGFRLSRNFGHQGALLAGLNKARGDAIISMDGDLQHPPEVIPQMLAEWRAGSKVVITRRRDAESTTAFKRMTSQYFYRVFSSIAETTIEPGTSDFRLLDRQALGELLRLNYGEPFLRGAVQLLGFRRTTVEFDVGERFSGKSKYTLAKMLRFARQGLISHSVVPLRIGIWLGLAMGVVSFAEIGYIIFQYSAGNTVEGWASTLGLMSLLFSVLFVVIGVIGLYLEDIHKLLKGRPHFIIADAVGTPIDRA